MLTGAGYEIIGDRPVNQQIKGGINALAVFKR